MALDMALLALPQMPHDEGHFLEQGMTIYKGDWLGSYNHFTLIKGPFYPMFLALNRFIGLPLLLSELLLYISACFLVVTVIRKIVKSNIFSIFLFSLLLFNPIIYTTTLTKVLREGIYPAMAILSLFSIASLYFSFLEKEKLSIRWIILSGLVLSGFWLTKEDGIWLFPAIIFLAGFFIFKLIKGKRLTKNAILTLIVPFIILLSTVNLICIINQWNYGIYEVVEFNNTEFKDAYGSLTRIKPDTQKLYIPVNKTTREKLYAVVPAFNELKEGEPIFNVWSTYNPYCEKLPHACNEIAGGWFMWSLRDVVAYKGYYENSQKAKEYYKRLSTEINEACDSEKLDCYPMRSSFLPRLYKEDYYRTLESFRKGWFDLLTLKGFSTKGGSSIGTPEQLVQVRIFTGNKIKEEKPKEENSIGNLKLKLLGSTSYIYSIAALPLFVVSLFFILFTIVKLLFKREMPSLVVVLLLSLLLAVNSRMLVLALVDSTSFPAINILYMSPIYPLVYIIISLSCYEILALFKDTKKAV